MRRLLSCLLALVCVVGAASAATPRNPELVEYDYFYIYKGGEPAVSDKFMMKTDNSDSMYTEIEKSPTSSINWLSSETVYWRGRSSSLARATSLGESNVPTWRSLTYSSGYGSYGSSYTIAAEYASSNPYTHLEVMIAWIS